MKNLFTILAIACVSIIAACAVQGGSGQQSTDAISINGRKITAAELVTHPLFRAPLKQYILTESMLSYASERGFTADEEKLDEEFQNIEMAASQQGMTPEEFMDQQGMSVEEWRESTSIRLIFEAMLDAETQVTDDEIEQEWMKSSDRYRKTYARSHGLTDEESANISFDDVKENIIETLKGTKRSMAQEKLLQEITDGTDFQVLCVAGEEADRNEYLIFNHSKTEEIEKQMENAMTPEERIMQHELEQDQAREAQSQSEEGKDPEAGNAAEEKPEEPTE